MPLEQLCLRILAMGQKDVHKVIFFVLLCCGAPMRRHSRLMSCVRHLSAVQFLGTFLDAPATASIDGALGVLHSLSAVDSKQNITPLGKHLAELPLDVRLAKLLIFGAVLQCLDPVLTIAACMVRVHPTFALGETGERHLCEGRPGASLPVSQPFCAHAERCASPLPWTELPLFLPEPFGKAPGGERGQNALLYRQE